MTVSGNEKEIDEQIVRNHVEKLLTKMSLKNAKVDIASGSLNGDNYLGLIAKVIVRGEDATGKITTLNWIVKCATTSEGFREITKLEVAYEREAYVYNKVFPIFEEFQKERGVENPFKSYSKCYYTSLEPLNEALIFENMKEIGYQLADKNKTLDFDHVLLLAREYGKLHAVSFALKDQKPNVFEELKNDMEINFTDRFSDNDLQKFVDSYKELVVDSLDPIEDRVAIEKYLQFTENGVQHCRNRFKKDKYSIFIHGDCWVNNMLFKYGDITKPNYPTDLCLLDFQISTIASPIIDITYFLFSSVGNDLLQNYYDFFLEEYYKTLSNGIKELGSDPEKLYPKEVFQQQLKDNACQGLATAIMVIKIMVSDSEEIPDVNACTDMDGFVSTLNAKTKHLDEYKKRVRDVVLHCVKYGYI